MLTKLAGVHAGLNWEWKRRGAGCGVHGYTNSCTALIMRENDTVTARDQNQQMSWYFLVVSGRCAAEYRIHSCCSTDSSILSLTFLGKIWIGLPDDRWILSSAVEHIATTTMQQQQQQRNNNATMWPLRGWQTFYLEDPNFSRQGHLS